jgi:hypothetical protein
MVYTTGPGRPCACGCGTIVRGTWARGHAARGAGGYTAGTVRFPGPDDPVWDEPDDTIDLGELVPDDPPADLPDPGPGAAEPASPPLLEAGPAAPDPPPAHARREWRKQPKASKASPAKPVRVTAGIRADINGKISMALDIPGRLWQARDPVCGGTFVEQVPEMAQAWTNYVCQSPDLVNWFTGTGGSFMLLLDILASMWPVATVVMAHHVYHSVELEGQAEPGPVQNYAA